MSLRRVAELTRDTMNKLRFVYSIQIGGDGYVSFSIIEFLSLQDTETSHIKVYSIEGYIINKKILQKMINKLPPICYF